MKLSEALGEVAAQKKSCKACPIFDALDEDDRVYAIETIRGNTDTTKEDLAFALTKMGYPVSESTLRRHVKYCIGETNGRSE